uniref:Peptide-methionine (R)-S-oxide reductase n=1 Tax=Petromyzon marinus TaxID=7757 RepID=S4RB72_PETMA
ANPSMRAPSPRELCLRCAAGKTVGGMRGCLPCAVPTASCKDTRTCRVNFAEEELRKKLSPLEFHVTQEKGTEPAFTGKFAEHKGKGTYGCVVCQAPLFASQAKYDSGSGWPSFYNIIRANAVSHSKDRSHGMHRTEVTCGQCG